MQKEAEQKKAASLKKRPRAASRAKIPSSSAPCESGDCTQNLRRRAEEKVRELEIPTQGLSPDEAARLIHELQIHQIELEMQNEELRLSQTLLEESRTKYADLYDFAPVGYLAVDTRGRIVEANLTAAAMLGVERHKIVGRFFSHFLEEEDRWVFRRLLENTAAQQKLQGELHLIVKGNHRLILLDILCLKDAEGQERRRLAMTDITERQRAEAALRESEERLRFLSNQLLTTQENERKRIAAELHDELGHALIALKLHLSTIEKKMLPEQGDLKEEIHAQLDFISEVIQDVRRLYYDLSPGDVEDLGLTKALRMLINEFAAHFSGAVWQVNLVDLEGLFPLPVQTIIYRIFQEALTNIGKHARPTQVTISSKMELNRVHFVVYDNGVGFDVSELDATGQGRGLGLVAMQERLNMLGGSFQIQSRRQRGTRLSFTIPVQPPARKP